MDKNIDGVNTKCSTSHWFPVRKTLAFFALAVGTLFTLFMVMPVKNACIATLDSGRQITVVSDTLFLDLHKDHDTIKIAARGKLIVVQPDSILVDDQQIESLDPELMELKIDCRDGKVQFERGKGPIRQARLMK